MTAKTLVSAVIAIGLLTAPAARASDLLKGAVGVAIGAGIYCGVSGKCGTQKKTRTTTTRKSSGISSAQRAENRSVQTALNAFGFPVGTADGALGPKSRSGIRNYQAYMNYPVTGYLDDYQRGILLESYNRYQAGGAAAYPNVMAQVGPKGLLKAFHDPAFAQQYREPSLPPAQPPVSTLAAAPSVVTPQVVPPRVAAPEAPRAAAPDAAGNTLPKLAPLPKIGGSASVLARCDAVRRKTRANNGLMLVSNISDPDQALSEQFCAARDYAIGVSETIVAQLELPADQLSETCDQITSAMAPVTVKLVSAKPDATIDAARSVNSDLGVSDRQTAGTYGRICMGLGYAEDDAETALSGALMMVGAGFVPYGEMIAHHQREGFGVEKNTSGAGGWYRASLDAVEATGEPVFLPEETGRATLIRTAVDMTDLRAEGTLPRLPMIKPAGGKVEEASFAPQ